MAVLRRTRTTVPFVPVINTKGDPGQQVAQQLTQLIQHHEQSGWRFCHLEDVTTLQNNGCLAGLFGNPTTTRIIQVAVFEHDDPPEPDPRQVFGQP